VKNNEHLDELRQTRKDVMNMTVTMNTGINGRVARQSLANEIDRLDKMLDGLSDGLNEAVAEAVKVAVGTAVREAAQAVLTEVFANPEIRSRLSAIPTAAVLMTPAKPTLRQRLGSLFQGVRSCLAGICRACASSVLQLPSSVNSGWQRMLRGLANLWDRRHAVTQFKYQLLTALGVGSVAGAAAYFAGPWIAAGVSAAGGFATTLAVQAGVWMRKVLSFNLEQIA
jgi:hypothetical protein